MQFAESPVTHPRGADPRGANWTAKLRAVGLRTTTQRLAVLAFLDHNPHSDADTIFRGVRDVLPTVSVQAIHGIVNDLSAAQIIRRVNLADSSSAQYETRTKDNHHHVQCIRCGRIEDVDCTVGHAPCLTPSNTHGMRIIETDLTFRGLCTDCEREEK